MRADRGNDLMGIPDSSFVADRQLMAAARATAREHGAAILRFHPRPESMGLGALAIIGLKCTFRHRLSSLARAGAPVRKNLRRF